MTRDPDIEFEGLLRSLAVPPDDAEWREELKEKMRARAALTFKSDFEASNPFVVTNEGK